MTVPDCQPKIQPTALVFPLSSRNGIKTEKYIRLTHFHVFGAVDQCCTSSQLSIMHDLGVETGPFGVEA